jgi:hypothetical protein
MAKISKCVKTFIVFLLLLQFSMAQAETYVQVNGASLHDRSGYNGFNWGAGLEQGITDRWSYSWWLVSQQ